MSSLIRLFSTGSGRLAAGDPDIFCPAIAQPKQVLFLALCFLRRQPETQRSLLSGSQLGERCDDVRAAHAPVLRPLARAARADRAVAPELYSDDAAQVRVRAAVHDHHIRIIRLKGIHDPHHQFFAASLEVFDLLGSHVSLNSTNDLHYIELVDSMIAVWGNTSFSLSRLS